MARSSISGGCQCGSIRYRIDGPLGMAGICHCRMCQKAFGSWGAALVSVPVSSLAWTRGEPSEFRSSAIVARGFCADCGTPLYMKEDSYTVWEIAIGTLDDPRAAPPDHQVGVESELPWFATLHTLPRRRTDEDRSPEDLARLKSFQHPDHDTETWP
jgi:hypothetical protein